MVCVQKWAEEWRKRTEDPDHMRALEALVRLLKNDVSPLDAAKEITAAYEISLKVPLPVPRKNTLYYNKVCDFWALYMSDAIRIFGSIGERERLCQLLTEISRQPDVLDDNGFPVKGYDRDGVYWSDLPAWHLMFGMHCLDVPYAEGYFDSEREQYLARVLGYLNATAFAAKLLKNRVCVATFSFEAACALNIGLEHDYDHTSGRVAGLDSDNWPTLIPAAGIWLLIVGKQIYDHCMSGDRSHGWGRGRWNRESWYLWKKQLGKFAGRADFTEDCRDFAAATLQEMLRIEGEDIGVD